MAITRTARGTAQSKTSGTTLQIAAQSLNARDLLVVFLAYDDQTLSSVFWGTQQMTLGDPVLGAGVRSRLAWCEADATASRTITATWAAALTAKAMVADSFRSSVTTAGFTWKEDSNATNAGNGTAASTAATDAITGGTESIRVGVVGTEGPSGDVAGTWVEPNTNGQRVGTTGSSAQSNVTVSSGYRLAPTAGSTTGLSKTGMTSRDWGAAIRSFYWSGSASLTRTSSDTLSSISDTVGRVLTFPRTSSDTLSAITDTADRVLTFGRTAADTLSSLSESVARFYKNSFGGGGGGPIAATHRAIANSGTDATSYTTATFTPTAGSLLTASIVNSFGSAAPDLPTVTGHGLTWVQVATYTPDTSGTQYRMSIYAAIVGGSPGNSTVTADFGAQVQGGCNIVVDEFTGVDTSGGVVAAFRQTKTGSANSSGTSEAITLDTAINSGNATGGVFYHQVNETGTTPDTGYTLLGEAAHSGPSDTTATIWRADGQTSVGASWVTSGSRGSIAWELKVAAGGGGEGLLRSTSDTTSITDSVVRAFVLARTLVDTISTSDAIATIKTFPRTVADTVAIGADTVVRVFSTFKTATDSVAGITDSVTRIANKVRTAAESLTISDSVSRVNSTLRTAADSVVGLTDSIVRAALSLTRSSADTTSLSESVSRISNKVRSVIDSVAVASGAFQSNVFQNNAFQSGAQSDSIIAIKSIVRTSVDTLSAISDSVARSALSLIRSASDTTTITESVARVANKIRTASDTVAGITDSVIRAAASKTRAAVDSVAGISDAVTRIVGQFRTSSDSTSVSDSVARGSISFARIASDTVNSISDTAARMVVFARTIADDVSGITDSIVREIISGSQTIYRTASDSVEGITDSVSRMLSVFRTSVDSTSVSDLVNRSLSTLRSATDSVVTSDAVARAIALFRTALDTTAISDSVSRAGLVLTRTTTDTLSAISDSVLRIVTVVRNASDSVGISDAIVRAWQGTRSAVDTLPAISDIITTGGLVLRFAADNVAIGVDSIGRWLSNTRGAVDSVSVSDAVERIGQYARSVQDSLSISDSVVRLGVVVRLTVEDTIDGVTDFVSRALNLPALKTEIIRIVARVNQPFKVFRNKGAGRVVDTDGSMNVPGKQNDFEVK